VEHDHTHTHNHKSGKNLRLAFVINLTFTVFEIVGGLMTNSVAILSDALHDLGDSLSLGLSWYLESKSRQKANVRYTFGYRRFSLLGALINSVILIAGSVYIITEAIARFIEPEPSDARGMFVFAVVGIAVNGYAAWKVSKGKSMNERVVSWHLIEDVLGWVAVLIVAIVLMIKPNLYLDPALSILITLYILWNVVKRLRDTLHLFLQGVPDEIDVPEIESKIMSINKVKSLHHMHVWSLEGESHVFSAHICLAHIDTFDELLEVKSHVKSILNNYAFDHFTIETELETETCSLVPSQPG